jgi:CRISPR/Cas system-associated endoribonuclease Cas2
LYQRATVNVISRHPVRQERNTQPFNRRLTHCLEIIAAKHVQASVFSGRMANHARPAKQIRTMQFID